MEQNNQFDDQHLISTYLQHADVAIESAELNLEHSFYTTAINRAYYAIFYAANGLLLTRGISRSKHSCVIAAFREQFIRTGLIETEYSDLYGDVMDARMDSDYEISFAADPVTAQKALSDACRFVERARCYLSNQERGQ